MEFDNRSAPGPLVHDPDPSLTLAERSIARSGMRFTIGYLMMATVVVAYLLAIPGLFYVIAITLSAPFLPVFAARWLLARRYRRLAAWSFWVAAGSINLYVAVSCVVPNTNFRTFNLIYPGLLVAIPMIGSFGTTWALLLSQDDAVSRRPGMLAGYAVVLMTVLPIVTLWTFWPLRLAFLVSRPGLERLANQVAAGNFVPFPLRAGVFEVVCPAVEPVRHTIGLRIDKAWRHPTGFVRLRPGATRKMYGPFLGQRFDVYLGDGWWYRG